MRTESNQHCSKKGFSLVAGLMIVALIGLGAYFLSPIATIAWLPALILLVCPLMMLTMHLGIHQHQGGHSCCRSSDSKQCHTQKNDSAQ